MVNDPDLVVESDEGEDTGAVRREHDRTALSWFGCGAAVGAIVTVGALLVTGVWRPAGMGMPASSGAIQTDASLPIADVAPGQGAEETFTVSTQIAIRPANTLGRADAPVTIVEYSDFNCAYCLQFHQQSYPAIIEDYVNTGKARFVYKQFAILGPDSTAAAQASECAAEQGKFWEFHDLLFARRAEGASLSAQVLDAAAIEAKLDVAQFAACRASKPAADRAQADMNEAQQLGFRGTPAFLINGKPIVGAQPVEVFRQVLDEALKQNESPQNSAP